MRRFPDTEFALRKKRLGSVMPKEEDLHGAARALIRLQEVYEMDISKLVKGKMEYNGKAFETMARLTAQVRHLFLALIQVKSFYVWSQCHTQILEQHNYTTLKKITLIGC